MPIAIIIIIIIIIIITIMIIVSVMISSISINDSFGISSVVPLAVVFEECFRNLRDLGPHRPVDAEGVGAGVASLGFHVRSGMGRDHGVWVFRGRSLVSKASRQTLQVGIHG